MENKIEDFEGEDTDPLRLEQDGGNNKKSSIVQQDTQIVQHHSKY